LGLCTLGTYHPCSSAGTREPVHIVLNDKKCRMHDTFPLESWISLLSFSTRFICDKIRARSIREIESVQSRVEPVERIVLAVRHNVSQWLSRAYQELCQRQESLSEEEGEKLGLSTVIKLMKAREMLLLSGPDTRDPRFFASRMAQARPPGMSSSSGFFNPSLEPPVRPTSAGELWGQASTWSAGLERFDPHRVEAVVREVFFSESSPR
jgi:hypothetical protein